MFGCDKKMSFKQNDRFFNCYRRCLQLWQSERLRPLIKILELIRAASRRRLFIGNCRVIILLVELTTSARELQSLNVDAWCWGVVNYGNSTIQISDIQLPFDEAHYASAQRKRTDYLKSENDKSLKTKWN